MITVIIKILAVLAAIAVISMVIDNRRFVVRNYMIRSSRIKYPVKAVFIADLHEKCYGSANEKLVDSIKKEGPDCIFVGGDLIVSGAVFKHSSRAARDNGSADPPEDTEWMKQSLSLMKRLCGICPVWFVQGNHELRLEAYEELHDYNIKFVEEMEKAGVRFLENGAADPFAERHGGRDSGIRLQGLELPIKYYRKFRKTPLSIEEVQHRIGTADRSKYAVLLTHTPVYFEKYAAWGADLCLCGHVHGGLMRLPVIGGVMGTRPNLFPKYSCGQYFCSAKTGDEKHLSSLILTCGLGTHTLPIRIFNPGEISVVELRPTGKEQEE